MQYGELYHRNFYKEAQDKNRVYYEYYHLDGTEEIPVDYKEISFVCLRPDGCLELPSTLSIACRSVAKGWTDLRISISTSCDTPTQATSSQTELPQKMCRNC
ncbi:hypothetical protein BACPEC_01760 [[Bacteroides] pectinophilus ATCC 43243]|uniref:Uncharacterized protein n=1 Tax=[Bacteroides] pectinophilus ATCC 43243 TaxID=483218 RepID=B7ARQ6_9FIRM|nr:hypothetical protein BACPEC_01760 [[Bacteroides] pectinophilus ATCC 43243]